jgi:flagellar hook assembly protein FlgD
MKNTISKPIDGSTSFDAKMLPYIKKGQYLIEFAVPERGEVELFVTDTNGKVVLETFYKKVKQGKKRIQFSIENTLPKGEYTFNFIYNEVFFDSEKVSVKE